MDNDKKAGAGEMDEKSKRPMDLADKYRAAAGTSSSALGTWNGSLSDSFFVCEKCLLNSSTG